MSLFFWDFDIQCVDARDQGESEMSTNYGVDCSDGPPASKEAESPSPLITSHHMGVNRIYYIYNCIFNV